jgi:hypothetical protein
MGVFFKPLLPFTSSTVFYIDLKPFTALANISKKLSIGGKPDFGWGGENKSTSRPDPAFLPIRRGRNLK